MHKTVNARFAAIMLASALTPAIAWAAGGNPAEVMKLMPADFPVAVVVVDFQKLDKSVTALMKRFDPQHDDEGMLADIKEELPIGDWVDFSKPIGFAGRGFGSESEPVLWVSVPEFATKVKTLEGAKEEEGIWIVPVKDDEPMFAVTRGAYVAASPDKELLKQACKEGGKSLADDLSTRIDLLRDRDAMVHVNFDVIRPMAAAGLAQAAQMAPMIAMMAGQQGGANPAAIGGMVNVFVDAAKQFVDQVAYVDIVLGLTDKAGDVTLATGYREGAIKNYLGRQKPATTSLVPEVDDQAYFMAMGCQVPGNEAPLADYFCNKLEAAMAPPGGGGGGTPGGEGGANAGGVDAAKIKESLQVQRDLYRKIEGWGMVMSLSPTGMKMAGEYLGGDAKGIAELVKKTLTLPNPMASGMGPGAAYEPTGSKKIGNVTTDEFMMKVNTGNPMADAMVKQMFGENPRMLMGVAGDRVKFCMGSDEEAQRVFAGKPAKPLASSEYVKESMARLPAKRNALLLIDPAGVLPMAATMMGAPLKEAVPPGPPVAISVSVSGEPARVDIHVPIRAIERVKQALSPQEPM